MDLLLASFSIIKYTPPPASPFKGTALPDLRKRNGMGDEEMMGSQRWVDEVYTEFTLSNLITII